MAVIKSAKKDHPSLDIVGSHGTELSGKKIVLCVTGSVAAYKAIELARLLMRHGAEVTCVPSSAATKLVKPAYFRWATGNEVVTTLSSKLEHIKLADYNKSDLVVVYPSTANTLGKLASGIDDTPISTILTVALGSKTPIIMCMAMHAAMYENLAVKKNIKFLKNKIEFLRPLMVEGKAKVPEPEDVLEHILGKFGASLILRNKRVLMTVGPTIEYVDPVRFITNQSSGRTGMLLAAELISAGARVTIIYGPGTEMPPRGARIINVETGKQMLDAIKIQLKKKFDIVIMTAAVSDYTPKNPSRKKIDSKKLPTINLKKTPKIIDMVRRSQEKTFMVGFKAEADIPKEILIRKARKKLQDARADIIIANDVGKKYLKNRDMNEIFVVDSKQVISSGRKTKKVIARFIRKQIEMRIQSV